MILEKDFFSLFKYFGILSPPAMELLYIPYYIWKVVIFTLQKRIKKTEKIINRIFSDTKEIIRKKT